VRAAFAKKITRRAPERARELARLAEQDGGLLPKLAWPELSVIAVWTGGSVGIYLPELNEFYGAKAIRDHGLSASEGRMTIPLADATSVGILDFYHHYFEFIPVEDHESARPIVIEAHELEVGRDYFIVLTTSGGLYRYDIQDVVRCAGFEKEAPLLEFLNKGKNFSNITGEKLSEYQVVHAVEQTFDEMQMPIEAFTLAPVMERQPRYVLLIEHQVDQPFATKLSDRLQENLVKMNEEYASKCASGRLLPVKIREVRPGTWRTLRQQKAKVTGGTEQYKQPCLVQSLSFVEQLVGRRPRVVPDTPEGLWQRSLAGDEPGRWRRTGTAKDAT
jgi:hypothetical protein